MGIVYIPSFWSVNSADVGFAGYAPVFHTVGFHRRNFRDITRAVINLKVYNRYIGAFVIVGIGTVKQILCGYRLGALVINSQVVELHIVGVCRDVNFERNTNGFTAVRVAVAAVGYG